MFEHRRSRAEPGSMEEPQTEASPAIAATRTGAVTVLVDPPRSDPRARLFGAMLETVAERGYDRTTVSRLLARAEVPEAVFSEHFRDKHDCFMHAVDGVIGRTESSAIELFSQARPWSEKVSLGLGRLLTALALQPYVASVVFVEMLGAGPAACERHREALSLFASLVDEGREQCADSAHLPEQTAEAIVGGVAAIVHRRALQGKVAELPALRADLTYFVLLPFLEQERAAEVAGLA